MEGIDNDGDGRINEDPVSGYDMNRNWAWDWQPNFVQSGAQDYPFLSRKRAISAFVIEHPNLAAFQSYQCKRHDPAATPDARGAMRPPMMLCFKPLPNAAKRCCPSIVR